MENLLEIVHKFNIESLIVKIEPINEGFLNDTYIVYSHGACDNYILQKKNKNIFKNIPGMMENIHKVTSHLKAKIIHTGGDPKRESLTVIKTKEGSLFFLDEKVDYWTMYLLIDDHVTYLEANSPELAFAGGKGIGRFQSMLSDFEGDLVDTLPGFHDIEFRFQQWDQVLESNSAGRVKDLEEEILWVESRRSEMIEFWSLIASGILPKRITHNDTKISNILFDKSGNVLCVIDLDTVLRGPVFNDVGDAIRSYANTGQEDDQNLNKVSMDINIFRSFTEGYLSEAESFLNDLEIKYLSFAARYITFEQVLRFLMDYIDGDNYYKIQSPQHNLIRTRAQYKLLQSIEYQMYEMNKIVHQLIKKYRA